MKEHPDPRESSRQYRLVTQALFYMAEHRASQPSLADVAARMGLSEHHFQRLFSDWVGISPKRFLQFLSKEYIKSRLDARDAALEAAFDAGLSGPSRLHDLFVATESITPGQYRSMGRDLCIQYGFHDSPFGEYLLAVTQRGICHLHFTDGDRSGAETALAEDWQAATRIHDEAYTTPVHERIFGAGFSPDKPLHLLLKGTNFQVKVWEALLAIPFGEVSHYQGLAGRLGTPGAMRAAASAVGANRIAFLIPCHRVARKIGEAGEYRWGRRRKRIMLAWEAARSGEYDPLAPEKSGRQGHESQGTEEHRPSRQDEVHDGY